MAIRLSGSDEGLPIWNGLPELDGKCEVRVPYDDAQAVPFIAGCLHNFLVKMSKPAPRRVVLLCIGTDRSTGDALGPLIGQQLKVFGPPEVAVLGTLDHPVHASNLEETLRVIERDYAQPLTIAVDACLGQAANVGLINVGLGPLRPGAGVNKNLPAVGDLYITGTVNVGGMMEYLVLQNTRLSLVMKMADAISAAVSQAIDAYRATLSAPAHPLDVALPQASGQRPR